jgi:mannose-6-phosphate isomerase-like protein (cupin superfamily)
MAEASFHLGRLADAGLTVLAGSQPPSPSTFLSTAVQAIHFVGDASWADERSHAHEQSDEIFVVLEGRIVIATASGEVTVSAEEFCCFPAGVEHAVVRAEPPTRHFVIRAPSVQDKVYPESL